MDLLNPTLLLETAITELNAAKAQQPRHFDVLMNLGAAEGREEALGCGQGALEATVALNASEAEAYFQLLTVLRVGEEVGATSWANEHFVSTDKQQSYLVRIVSRERTLY